jgi:hypothetical protein
VEEGLVTLHVLILETPICSSTIAFSYGDEDAK